LTAPVATYPNPAANINDYKDLEVSEVILTIDGTGAMFNFENANEIDVPWYKYASSVTRIVIADGITSVGSNSFGGFTRLKTVEIGSGVTTIGESAFKDCTSKNFTKIDIPANVKTISKNAFYNTSLKEVSLRGVNYIGEAAFKASKSIKQLLLIPGEVGGKILLKTEKEAFHPGAVGSTNSSHALSTGKIFYRGNASTFVEMPTDSSALTEGAYFASGNDVIFDNITKAAAAAVYSYAQESADLPATSPNGEGYWRFAENQDGTLTSIPIQYCFSVQYTVAGVSLPIATFYIPVSEKLDKSGNIILDEEGVPELQALVTRELVARQEGITHEGYKFADFTGGNLVEGDYIQDDKILVCSRGDILSDDGGIVWSYNKDAKILTVSKNTAAEANIIADVKADFIYDHILALYNADVATLGEAAAQDKYYSDFNKKVAWPIWTNAATVALNADLAKADSTVNAAIEERLAKAYRIWDFKSTASTQSLWTGKIADVIGIEALVIGEGVEYIGDNTFFGLAAITNVILPASLEGISTSAFGGNTKLEYLYFNATDASECYFYSAGEAITTGGETPVKVDITKTDKDYLEGTPATVYTKFAPMADSSVQIGSFWTDITDKKLAWTVSANTVTVNEVETTEYSLTVGGADEMVDFSDSADAPWYFNGAKTSVTTAVFKDNITKLGANVLNGYAGVENLTLALNLTYVPANSFVGTAIYENTAAYDGGMLVVDGILLNIDAARLNKKHLDTVYGTKIIAEGALVGATRLETLFVTSTLLYINSGAFYNDANIKTVYTESAPQAWASSVAKDVALGDASVYFNSSSTPSEADEEQYNFYYKNGNEFVVWGCSHVWGEWVVDTPATCMMEGRKMRTCIYDSNHVAYETIEKSNAHSWTAWNVIPATADDAAHEARSCNCGASEKKYLEGVVTLEGASNSVVLSAGQTNWFNVPYSESGFLLVKSDDVIVRYGSSQYKSVSYKNSVVLNGYVYIPLLASAGNEAFIGIETLDTVSEASTAVDVEFVAASTFTKLNAGDNSVSIAANGSALVLVEYTDIGSIVIGGEDKDKAGALYNGYASAAQSSELAPGYFIYDCEFAVVGANVKGYALIVLFNTSNEVIDLTVNARTSNN